MVEVQKGIKLPPPSKGGPPFVYPWLTMKIGESFLFPIALSRGSASATATNAGKRYGRKFAVRKTDDGYRCWRIS